MNKQLTVTKIGFAIGFILLVLAAAAARADQTLARLAGVAAPRSLKTAIRSEEIQFTAAELGSIGTLDGLLISDAGLVLAPGRLQGSITSAPVNSPLGYTTDIVPLWQAQIPAGSDLRLETRLSTDGGQSWSDWLANHEAFYPVRNRLHSGNLLWAGSDDVALQVRVTLQTVLGGDPPRLDALELVFNDTSRSPKFDSVAVTFASNSAPAGKPPVVSRTDWGNPDGPDSPRRPPQYAPVTHVIIHQTETPNSAAPYQDYAGWVRAIWNFHANVLGWGDIGYNYLIDPNGVIYEGRAGGDEVIGIHDARNAHSMAVGLIGCYGNCDNPYLSVAEPPAAMIDSLVQLSAWQMGRQGIDPHSSAGYHNLPDVPVIAGGRDVAWTSSPGDNVYNRLPEIRTAVANLNAGLAPVLPETAPPAASPESTPAPASTPAPGSSPTVAPTATSTDVPGPQACRITNIIFDRESYLTGDTIDVTVKLADPAGLPLAGALIDAGVTRNPSETPIITVFEIDDRSGEYRAQYPATELPGYYTFAFTAFDPAAWRFTPCSGMIAVQVTEPVVEPPTPTPTVIAVGQGPAPTTLPGAVDGATPMPTGTTVGTVPPTATRTTGTVAPTATATASPTPTATTTGSASTPTATATTDPGLQGTALVFTPASQTITVCDNQTTVAIGVQDVADMSAMQMDVVFDAAVLQVIDTDPGQDGVQVRVDSVFDGGFVAANDVDNDTGRLTFAVTLFNGNSINGDSGIIEIDFEPVGAGNSALSLESVILASAQAQPIDHQIGSGRIEILANCESGAAIQADDFVVGSRSNISWLAGDTNGDNRVNSLDLALIARVYGSTAGPADLNGDGLVDIQDVVQAASRYNPAGILVAAR